MEQTRSTSDGRLATLLLHSELRVGLAADLTRFVQTNGGRIVYHDHYVDNEINRYYTRLQWDLASFTVADSDIGDHLTTLAGGALGALTIRARGLSRLGRAAALAAAILSLAPAVHVLALPLSGGRLPLERLLQVGASHWNVLAGARYLAVISRDAAGKVTVVGY